MAHHNRTKPSDSVISEAALMYILCQLPAVCVKCLSPNGSIVFFLFLPVFCAAFMLFMNLQPMTFFFMTRDTSGAKMAALLHCHATWHWETIAMWTQIKRLKASWHACWNMAAPLHSPWVQGVPQGSLLIPITLHYYDTWQLMAWFCHYFWHCFCHYLSLMFPCCHDCLSLSLSFPQETI